MALVVAQPARRPTVSGRCLAVCVLAFVICFSGISFCNVTRPLVGQQFGRQVEGTRLRICMPHPAEDDESATMMMAKPRAGRPGMPQKAPIPMITPDEMSGEEFSDEVKQRLVTRGLETPDMVDAKISKKTKWLSSLKGKFVPYGPKPWDAPQFKKVCIEVSLDPKQASNTKIMNQVIEELRLISGKHPTVRKSKQNVATWQLRKGFPCGAGVHLTGRLMYDFLERLNMVILPRVRDFEGLKPTSFDKAANFQMGFTSQEPFRELDQMIDDREITHGFYVGITNNCLTQPEALKLMKDFGFPFNDDLVKTKPLYKVRRFNLKR
mmetsp:Transcript_25168/g.46125  ORF Transcript_25168/g.46125 Transcript_25168/m.46125 type:complete len:323 (-) Transcript_25168:70-1038(-)